MEIPLHLLPQIVARKVREWGAVMYRISIMRTHWHHYNVTVRTRVIRQDPGHTGEAGISSDPQPLTGRVSRKVRRECTS